ncbi:hypothetical protein DFR38_104245 [Aquitalea magnusonii]|uniref:Uncharacterized protein n=1 Tax=Aquitalea magnusonii TaxID=332411 RepID=A0A318JN32_9NEIS|nr:hypothetical protein DFR38_104245 [Aquitalea magnusonii]
MASSAAPCPARKEREFAQPGVAWGCRGAGDAAPLPARRAAPPRKHAARATGIGAHHITVGIDTTPVVCIAGRQKKTGAVAPVNDIPHEMYSPSTNCKALPRPPPWRAGQHPVRSSQHKRALRVCRWICEIFPTQLIKHYCIQSYKQALTVQYQDLSLLFDQIIQSLAQQPPRRHRQRPPPMSTRQGPGPRAKC